MKELISKALYDFSILYRVEILFICLYIFNRQWLNNWLTTNFTEILERMCSTSNENSLKVVVFNSQCGPPCTLWIVSYFKKFYVAILFNFIAAENNLCYQITIIKTEFPVFSLWPTLGLCHSLTNFPLFLLLGYITRQHSFSFHIEWSSVNNSINQSESLKHKQYKLLSEVR